jgi:hypothetical protein
MISQIETGDVKPDENEKHTRNCRSAMFGAKAALHVHQWLISITYALGGRSATLSLTLGSLATPYLRHHLYSKCGLMDIKDPKKANKGGSSRLTDRRGERRGLL